MGQLSVTNADEHFGGLHALASVSLGVKGWR